MITYQYEQYKPVRQVWTWLAILLLAVATLGWGMVTHMAIPDVPRHWDFDTLPDTPGQSVYATVSAARKGGAGADATAAGPRGQRGTETGGRMRKLSMLSWFFKAASVTHTLFSGPPPGDETMKAASHRRGFRRFTKVGAVVFVCGAAGAATVALYLMFSGPRMRIQPKYLPYQAQMPPAPEGSMAISPSAQVSLVPADIPLENPLPDTEKTLATGRVYYGYYCGFCHGAAGQATGPVGRSYVPAPTRLTEPGVQAMSDAELYRAMLTGVGHEPVLSYVIDSQARWYIIRYVRALPNQRP